MFLKKFGTIFTMVLHINTLAYSKNISVASYNVENLWDGVASNTDDNWQNFLESLEEKKNMFLPKTIQYDDYSQARSNWYDPSILKSKVVNFIEVLRLSGYPTIVGLQELESSGNHSLVFDLPFDGHRSLRDRLKELGYHYILLGKQEKQNPTSVTTAFISKIPMQAQQSVLVNQGKFSASDRDVQVVKVKIHAQDLLIFNVHLKSKSGGGERHRLATAQLIKERIKKEKKLHPYVEIILLGDFNASYEEKPMKALGSTGDETLMTQEATNQFYNLWYELEKEQRWESVFNGVKGRLSHILISDTLYNKQGLQYLEESFHVVGHHKSQKALINSQGTPYRWQIQKHWNRKVKHIGRGYSDHLPIVAHFKVLPPESKETSKGKIDLQHPSKEDDHSDQDIFFPEVDLCKEEESVSYEDIACSKVDAYLSRCVKVIIPESETGLELQQWGKYREGYVQLSCRTEKGEQQNLNVGLVMLSPFNWRPNIYDPRVGEKEAKIKRGVYHARKAHPKSNQCFHRSVLSNRGGKLRKAVGRLEYFNGRLSLIIASREETHLKLESLPSSKREACPWH